MTCNRCAATTEAVAPTAGAGHIEANWAGNRAHPQYCDDCHGFLRRDGGCTRCEAAQFADNAQWLAENLTGDAAAENEWKPSPDEPAFTAMAIAAVRGGKTLTWRDEAEETPGGAGIAVRPVAGAVWR